MERRRSGLRLRSLFRHHCTHTIGRVAGGQGSSIASTPVGCRKTPATAGVLVQRWSKALRIGPKENEAPGCGWMYRSAGSVTTKVTTVKFRCSEVFVLPAQLHVLVSGEASREVLRPNSAAEGRKEVCLMKLTREQSQRLLNQHGIWIPEACDKCGQVLGSVRWTRRAEPGEWCSAECRDGKAAKSEQKVARQARLGSKPAGTPKKHKSSAEKCRNYRELFKAGSVTRSTPLEVTENMQVTEKIALHVVCLQLQIERSKQLLMRNDLFGLWCDFPRKEKR
jgi:hypothetical protein